MTPAGPALSSHLEANLIARTMQMRIERIQLRVGELQMAEAKKPKPGSRFFALVAEREASGGRLDILADKFAETMKEAETAAVKAVSDQIEKYKTVVQDYIDQVADVTEHLKEDNGGPSLQPEGTEKSSASSQPPKLPSAANLPGKF